MWLLAQRANYTGWTAVAVRCENCRRKYYYRLERTGRGEANTKEQARRIAKARLLKMLDCDIDPVPCPECGWYQEDMLPLLRKPRLRWMQHLGIACALFGACFLLPIILYFDKNTRLADKTSLQIVVNCGACWAALMVAAASVFVLRSYLNRRYNPNDPETEQERIELGRSRSITQEQAEELVEYVVRRG
jgi:hypothetical protein